MYKNKKVDLGELLATGAMEVFLKEINGQVKYFESVSRYDELVRLLIPYKEILANNNELYISLVCALIENGNYTEGLQEYILLIRQLENKCIDQETVKHGLRKIDSSLGKITEMDISVFRISVMNILLIVRNRIRDHWLPKGEEVKQINEYIAKCLLVFDQTIEFFVLIEVASKLGHDVRPIFDYWFKRYRKKQDEVLIKNNDFIKSYISENHKKITLSAEGNDELNDEFGTVVRGERDIYENKEFELMNIKEDEMIASADTIVTKTQLGLLAGGDADAVVALIQLGHYQKAVDLIGILLDSKKITIAKKQLLEEIVERSRCSEKN